MTSPYLLLFTDSVFSSTLIPIYSQAAFFAMRSFGGYDMHAAAAIAVAGATLGHSINWLLGQCLYRLHKAGKLSFAGNYYAKLAPLFRRYGVFTLLFSFLPLFELFTFAAGLFNVPARRALPLIILGQAAYYVYYLSV